MSIFVTCNGSSQPQFKPTLKLFLHCILIITAAVIYLTRLSSQPIGLLPSALVGWIIACVWALPYWVDLARNRDPELDEDEYDDYDWTVSATMIIGGPLSLLMMLFFIFWEERM